MRYYHIFVLNCPPLIISRKKTYNVKQTYIWLLFFHCVFQSKKGLMRLKVDCAGKWFLISSYLLLSLQTDDRRPFSSGKWPNLGRKQVYKSGKVVICRQYRSLMRSFQEGEEECLWVKRQISSKGINQRKGEDPPSHCKKYLWERRNGMIYVNRLTLYNQNIEMIFRKPNKWYLKTNNSCREIKKK